MNQQVAPQDDDVLNSSSPALAIEAFIRRYRDLLAKTTTDTQEIYVFECYVRDLCDLLRNSIKYFQESEACTKAVHNRKISKLQEELKRYRALPGTGNCEAQQQEILHMMMNKLTVAGDKTTDLRHESDSNDLNRTTCSADLQRLMSDYESLRVENQELKSKMESNSTSDDAKMLQGKIQLLENELKELRSQSRFDDKLKQIAPQLDNGEGDSTGDSTGDQIGMVKKVQKENDILHARINHLEKEHREALKNDTSDMRALIHEIADKHDHVSHLRVKNRKLQERVEQLERKVQFREKIIRELRRTTKCHVQNISPMSLTPPRTPELKASDSCSNSDFDMYRSNYLTVPGQQIAKGDSCFSLYDLDQESGMGKSASEVNFTLCFDEANKDEIERLHHMISEMESENGCNRLLITKLEDELLMLRKSETRAKQSRELKSDKLRVLKYKVKAVGSKLLSGELVEKPKLHQNDLSMLEDELKPEYDILNNLTKAMNATKGNLDKLSEQNHELMTTMEGLRLDLNESLQRNQHLQSEIIKHKSSTLPDNQHPLADKSHPGNMFAFVNGVEHRKVCANIARLLSETLGKEIQSDTISELTSSSPESGESSLSNGHSLSDVISDWKRELEEKNCLLRDKIAVIHSLETQLKHKDAEICDVNDRCNSVELDRDKSCQMVNQLKSAIQIHNESIQFLKRQNIDLKDELDETKGKFEQHQEYYNEMKKRNLELETENNNLHMTITNMRGTIEDLKRGNAIKHSNDLEALNVSINLLNEQFYKENIQKDDQLNLLRDANLQLRGQVFDLNQDIVDLLEIVESLKNRRTLEDFKIAQKEQERQIEKEISNRERDINCLKHFRSRCADIESEYLDKMASQKIKSDSTIKELETEITALTEQLIQSHEQNTDYDDLMQQTAVLQNSMQDLETQNDILRKTIESYEGRFSELQVQLEKINFENGNLISEIDSLKSDITDKNKRISEVTLDHHKLEAEFEMQKKSCTCSPKSSPEKRSSSTVMQINDLKTKLMNKSLEQSKASDALKRKTQQYEKLQATSFDERNRLREDCLKSIQTIGELKSKISLLEMRVQEQNEEVVTSREKVNHAFSKMTALESELSSKTAMMEDLETREEKWRVHAYEISHEIKNRKEDAYKREEKLIQELNSKTNAMKDQTRIILQHENSIHHLKSENETLRAANASLNQRIAELRIELDELRTKERGLCDLLAKTEEELKTIKSEVFQLFNTSTIPEIKNVHGQMKNDQEDLQTKYNNLVADFNKLIEENRALYEIKSDTISAIEIFKKLQEESAEREKAYQTQIAKLQLDKRNLHKDRSRLTKQLLNKHRDMIILNSEIDKFRDVDDYDTRSTIQYNSLQPFQSVMYPSAIAPLLRASSNPDLATDPIAIDARNVTEKMQRTRQFWSHGIRVAASSLVNIPSQTPQTSPPEEPSKESDEPS